MHTPRLFSRFFGKQLVRNNRGDNELVALAFPDADMFTSGTLVYPLEVPEEFMSCLW